MKEKYQKLLKIDEILSTIRNKYEDVIEEINKTPTKVEMQLKDNSKSSKEAKTLFFGL
jgi:hypothetical protein